MTDRPRADLTSLQQEGADLFRSGAQATEAPVAPLHESFQRVDKAPVSGEEADAVAPAAAIPPPEVETAGSGPIGHAGDDGREPMAEIRTGPGMPKETANAIREEQRLAQDAQREQQGAHEAQRTGFTARGIALAQRYIEEAVTPALSGQFLKERVAENRRVGSGAYPLTEGNTETGRPAELPDARLQAVRSSLVSLNEGTRGITPPVRIAEARRLISEELDQQQEYRRGRVMLLDAEKQARQQIQVALKEAGPTFFGKEGRLSRRMRSLRACLRNLGNYNEIQQEVTKLKTVRNHKLAKDPRTVDAKIAQFEGRQRAHESIDGFLAQKDLDPYLRVAIESRLKGQPVDYGDLSNPANVLYQKVYEGTVDLLLGPSRPTGEVPSPALAVPAPIPAPGRKDGRASEMTEAEDESNMDDPVTKLRLSAKRNPETKRNQVDLRQAIQEGSDDPQGRAQTFINIAEAEGDAGESAREAQQLVADLLDDMKTMTPEELENTKSWLADFTGALMASERAQEFGVDLMEASLHVFRILSASGR